VTPAQVYRFWDFVEKSEGCWRWLGHTVGGYGRIRIGKKRVLAHRVAYEIEHGPIVPGKLVCHRCDNPRCVRASHLFLGTAKDNAADMVAKGRHRSTRGAAHFSRRHPELYQRGSAAFASRHPERYFGRRGSKLNADKVRLIRARVAAGERQASLAAEHGVTVQAINLAANRRTWRHVE
jgi:hypothetical protein